MRKALTVKATADVLVGHIGERAVTELRNNVHQGLRVSFTIMMLRPNKQNDQMLEGLPGTAG